jgi:hypothetical protein
MRAAAEKAKNDRLPGEEARDRARLARISTASGRTI